MSRARVLRYWLILSMSPLGQLLGALAPAFGLWVWGIRPSDLVFWIVMTPVAGIFLVLNASTFVSRRRRGVGWWAEATGVADLTVAEIARRDQLKKKEGHA